MTRRRTAPHLRRITAAFAAAALTAVGLITALPAHAAETGTDAEYCTTVTVTDTSPKTGVTVQVAGNGYVDLPNPTNKPEAGPQGVYAALRDVDTMPDDAINADTSIVPAVQYIWKGNITDGAWTTDLEAAVDDFTPDAKYEVIVWVAHGTITDDSLVGTVPVDVSSEDPATTCVTRAAAEPTEETDDATTESADETDDATSEPVDATDSTAPAQSETTTATTATAETTATTTTTEAEPVIECRAETAPATAGTPRLTWGVKSSFAQYIEGIGQGAITTANGAARVGQRFTWGAGSGSLNDNGVGTISFPGSVHFTAHDGILDTTLSNISITTSADQTGTMTATVTSNDMQGNDVSPGTVTFANLTFTSLDSTSGTANVTLAAAATPAFAGQYSAGDALDPLSIAIVGAQSETTVERCYDANGSLVNKDGSPAVAGLASTGVNPSGLLATGLAVAGIGAFLLLMVRRRSAVTNQ